MAIGEVASRRARTFGNAVNSQTLAYPGDVTAGNLLVCGGFTFAAGPPTISVTDTRGTSYTVLSFNPNSSETGWIAYGIAPSSGANTVTVNPSTASDFLSFSIDEFSGVDPTTPLSVDGGNATGASGIPIHSITTVTVNELIIGCMGYDGATTTIAPAGACTEIGEHEDNTSDEAHALVFRIVGAPDTYQVNWTLGATRTWQIMAASFREAVVAGTAQPVMIIVT
jgi:uncharacterized protein (DUF2237 family)